MYRIIESVGNFSQEVETFNSQDEASEFLEDRVNEEVLEDFRRDGITNLSELDSNLLDMAKETAFSYYAIEEI